MVDDVRDAWRQLKARPLRAAGLIGILVVCLSLSAAAVAVVDGVLLKPPPVRASNELFVIGPPNRLDRTRSESIDPEDLRELAASPAVAGTFSFINDFRMSRPGVLGVNMSRVSADFFDVLGVSPFIGQRLDPKEAGANPRPVVIGYRLWLGQFSGETTIVGSVQQLGEERVFVRGVMPAGFDFPLGATAWSLDYRATPLPFRMRSATGVVRMKRGANPTLLQLSGLPIVAERLGDYVHPSSAQSVLPVFIATIFMVVIGVLHAATMQVTRAIDRARDTAIRVAIGASWASILRRWSIEGVSLAGVALALSIAIAPPVLSATVALLPADLTFGQPIAIDYRTLAVTGVIALVAMSSFTLAPALVMARVSPIDVLHGRMGEMYNFGTGKGGWVLLGAQASLVTGLVYLGALALHSFQLANAVPLGIDADHLFVVGNLPRSAHGASDADAIVEQLRLVPGVATVAAGVSPFLTDRSMMPLAPSRPQTIAEERGMPPTDVRFVGRGYFNTVGLRLLEGRDFDPREDRSAVTVLSADLARRLGGDRSLVGTDVYMSSNSPVRVIGIVSDIRVMGPEYPPRRLAYLPASMQGSLTPDILVRFTPQADINARLPDIARIVATALDTKASITISDQGQQQYRLLAPQRGRATLLALLALVALVLGVAGMFVSADKTVRQGLRDSAVRIALGASPLAVAGHLILRVVRVVMIGAVVGCAGGILGARWASTLFVGVRSSDPVALVCAVAIVSASAVLASLSPARRAATVDPIALLNEA